jgi:hypothetical protein
MALPFTFFRYRKAKEELWQLKYFTIAKIIPNLQKQSSKRKPKSFKILLELYYNKSQVSTQEAKISSSFKHAHIKILDLLLLLLLLPRGPKSLKLYYIL